MDDIILITVVVLATIAVGLWWMLRTEVTANVPLRGDSIEILFRDGIVEHASDAALEALPIAIGMNSWDDLFELLNPHFPAFPMTPIQGAEPELTLTGKCPVFSQVRIVWRAESCTVTLRKRAASQPKKPENEELETLRMINALSPHPAWKTTPFGAVTWSNAAYAALGSRLPKGSFQPEKPIFTLPSTADKPLMTRVKIEVTDDDLPLWYDVSCTPLSSGMLYQATSLNALIRAEDAQRDFVQTLAKTFAHLSIGLAIFNRDRQLALFNPALIDLTGLSVSFLSPRPSLDSFFDALRENRRMPEPKNYVTWRHRMSELVSAAETGKFEEVWSLETGQTFSVKGRPHPDGAIAFLIEDISAEISLTRNFRAELEMGQSLADTFEDALAVFSQSGVLTFSNKAYDLLWGFDGDTSFAEVTIHDAVRMWKEKSAPNPLWQDLKNSVMSLENRHEWDMPISITGHFPMTCRVVPIASGATVVRFSRQTAAKATQLTIKSFIGG